MWIKICGIRDTATAAAVAGQRPDAIGLNFYRHTPRTVPVETAANIVRLLPAGVEPVGVFVNEPVRAIHEICAHCSLRTVQLHGDETPEDLRELAVLNEAYRIIRAWNLGPDGLELLGDYLARLETLGVRLAACLIDARIEGSYGGTGQTADWGLLDREYRCQQWPPMILAGGLTAGNVAEAIHTGRPWGVDVASGVESAPGEKNLALVEQFIKTARQAFDSTATKQ